MHTWVCVRFGRSRRAGGAGVLVARALSQPCGSRAPAAHAAAAPAIYRPSLRRARWDCAGAGGVVGMGTPRSGGSFEVAGGQGMWLGSFPDG